MESLFQGNQLRPRVSQSVRAYFDEAIEEVKVLLDPSGRLRPIEAFDLFLNPVLTDEDDTTIIVWPIYNLIPGAPEHTYSVVISAVARLNGIPVHGTGYRLHFEVVPPGTPPVITGPFYSIDSDEWVSMDRATEFLSKVIFSNELRKVIYDYDKDSIILGTQADLTPNSKILGDYDGLNLRLYARNLPFNAGYVKKLWQVSFPDQPLEHIYVNNSLSEDSFD